MKSYCFRPARKKDLKGLNRMTTGQSIVPKFTEKELKDGLYFVISDYENPDKIYGVSGVKDGSDRNKYLGWTCVDFPVQNKGIGRFLVNSVCNLGYHVHCRSYRLDVDNIGAFDAFKRVLCNADFKERIRDCDMFYYGENCQFADKALRRSGVCNLCGTDNYSCSVDLLSKSISVEAYKWTHDKIMYGYNYPISLDYEVRGNCVKLSNLVTGGSSKEEVSELIKRIINTLYCDVVLYLNKDAQHLLGDETFGADKVRRFVSKKEKLLNCENKDCRLGGCICECSEVMLVFKRFINF